MKAPTRGGLAAARVTCVFAVVAAVTLSSALCAAQTASDTAALRQFEEGVRRYQQGEYEGALAAFRGSLSMLASPNTRLYIARCFRALGKTASAYTSFRLSEREAIDRVNLGERRFAATRDAANREGAEMAPKVPRVTLVVPATRPRGLRVSIDDAGIPEAAWDTELELDPGRHVVAASAPRHEGLRLEIDVAEGQKMRVEVALARVPTAQLALDLRVRPVGVAVMLDGRALEIPVEGAQLELDAGPHVIEASAPGYVPVRWSGSLKDGERRSLVLKLETRPSSAPRIETPPWLFFATLGLSATSVAAGSYLAVGAKNDSDQQRRLDPQQREPSIKDDLSRRATFANVAFAAGALSAIGSTVLFFTTGWSKPETDGARVAPVVSPRSAGIAAEAAF